MVLGAAVEMGVGMGKNPDQGRGATGRFLHPSNGGMLSRAICCQDWQGYLHFLFFPSSAEPEHCLPHKGEWSPTPGHTPSQIALFCFPAMGFFGQSSPW